ncbi:MAG: hypothetical protein RLZZ175_3199 [Bacteroidota bacterium]|jgi:hypothetical protein
MKNTISILIFSFIFSFCTHKREVKNEVVNRVPKDSVKEIEVRKIISKYPNFHYKGEDDSTFQYLSVKFIDFKTIKYRRSASSKIVDCFNQYEGIAYLNSSKSLKEKIIFTDSKNRKISYLFDLDTNKVECKSPKFYNSIEFCERLIYDNILEKQ